MDTSFCEAGYASSLRSPRDCAACIIFLGLWLAAGKRRQEMVEQGIVSMRFQGRFLMFLSVASCFKAICMPTLPLLLRAG